MLRANGTLLTIDLSERESRTEDVDDVLASFVGGRGVATKLAHDRIPFDADPLGRRNRLYFSSGPLQQSRMSFTGRMNATAVSPLTGGIRSTNAGGFLSRNFVETGHAAVEIVGESDDLLAVHVTDDGVTFEEVPALEGATVSETSEYVETERDLGSEHLVTAGPAGENLVRYAAMMTSDTRAFGRGGLGAVMGAKNLKCVSFAGDSAPEVDVPDIQAAVHRDAANADDIMKRQGTTGSTELINDEFSLPTRYFSEFSFEDAAEIGGNAVEAKKYRRGTCSQCAFACKLPTREEERGLETEGPEFETVFSFGSNAGVGDVVDVMKSNSLCDELGLDTISCGVTVSAYLASVDEFGNAELVHDLVEKIARREGVGDLLAEGVARIHDELGVENWTSKGLEFAAHDGRVINGQGLSYATSNSGADHMYSEILTAEYSGELDPEGLDGKASFLVESENAAAFKDSAVVCAFSSGYVGEERLEELFDAEYGTLLDVGARVVELERHFNNRRGFDRSDDVLPYDLPGFEAALEEYYEARGWNGDGRVPEGRVESGD
ncbi:MULTISPECIES: aldehyde ferredoxin oxidoreductase family protein [Halorussus]|uniref:aldehyde ferredoxin oxidoreductase family protein n=1 Tax=Halorussus TaxID=1070314 RepID=UPI00209F67C8|nr:aldehyde ferredoxin oxidoreductase C-terminal domain-containing protein [Halorussus vallis]USZ75036.1 aldehyde ferredoxin oxidoreductase [Halorussus vallis]